MADAMDITAKAGEAAADAVAVCLTGRDCA
jgi:hypothetical protein